MKSLTTFTTTLALLVMFVSFSSAMLYSPELQAAKFEYPDNMIQKTTRNDAGSVFGNLISLVKWVGIGLGTLSLIISLVFMSPIVDSNSEKAKKGAKASVGVIVACILFDWGVSQLLAAFA